MKARIINQDEEARNILEKGEIFERRAIYVIFALIIAAIIVFRVLS